MERWKENNLSAILEYPFDFERYAEERLREIEDLDERKFVKQVLLEGLGAVIRGAEKKYEQLERRIYEEMEIADNQYETVFTVVKKNHYDPTNSTLHPVMKDDLEEEILREKLSHDRLHFLGSVFLAADDERQKTFMDRAPSFFVEKKTVEEQETTLHIEPAERYRGVMEELYQVFQDNHILWDTMNTGYLDKFYDVYVTGESSAVSLQDIRIHFEEFEEDIVYDLIPLWNMEWVTFDSADFMLPCINGIYFEHEFSLEDKEETDGYLIKTSEDILEIRHERKKIVIKSDQETFENWQALHIIQGEILRSLDYDAPLLTNRKKDSFIRRHSENRRVQLMTKTDLFRRITELDIQDFIEIADYEIHENARDFPAAEGMNWFVRDELFPLESRKVLLLKFRETQPGHYLNSSMMRFVISQMQLEISEYRCVGVLI